MLISIDTIPIIHKGYLQGYKVKLNNKKYPLKHGYYYKLLTRNKCIQLALKDMKGDPK